jgi:hypothetical protein
MSALSQTIAFVLPHDSRRAIGLATYVQVAWDRE